jgi:chromosome segregation ATPase
MAISRQQIAQIADSLYERGSVPTVQNIQNALELDEAKSSFSEIAFGLKQWRESTYENSPEIKSFNEEFIAKIVQKELTAIKDNISKQIAENVKKAIETGKSTISSTDVQIAELAELLETLYRQKQELEFDRNKLRDREAQAHNKINELKLDLKEVTTQYQISRDESHKLSSEIDFERKQYNELRLDRDKIFRENSEMIATLATIRHDSARLTESLNVSETKLAHLTKDREENLSKKAMAESLAQKAEHAKQEVLSRLEALADERPQFKATISTLEKRIATLENDNKNIAQALEVTKAKALAIVDERDRLVINSKKERQKIEQLELEIKQIRDESAKLRTSYETDKVSRKNQETGIESLKQQIITQNNHYQEMNKVRLNLEAQNSRLQEEIQSLKMRFSEKQQLWIKEKKNLQEKIEIERRHVSEMGTELRKIRG